MKASVIVAVSENGAIGKNNTLPWHLPNDLKFFKQKTMGHHMIMGRKTYESIGKPLPGRTSIIVTNDKTYKAEGCHIAYSIKEAFDLAKKSGENEAFVIGGAAVIKESLALVDRIYLTEVKTYVEDADVFLDNFNRSDWKEKSRENFQSDEKHAVPYSFVVLEKQ